MTLRPNEPQDLLKLKNILLFPWRVLRLFKQFHYDFIHQKYKVSYTFILL